MKNFILATVLAIFLAGCATSNPEAYMETSSPIFILNPPESKSVYVDFRDLHDDDDMDFVIMQALREHKYDIVKSEKSANIVVKGYVNYFKKIRQNATHGYIGVGFGYDSRRKRWGRDVDIGISHRFFDDSYEDAGYKGQASLLLQIKGKSGLENYSTNLNFKTDENSYSYSYAKSLFNKEIAQKILEFLSFK